MKPETILRRAIEKAQDNGWCEVDGQKAILEDLLNNGYQWLLFDHEFAKAFWGEKEICNPCLFEIPKDLKGIHCPNCSGCFCEVEAEKRIAWEHHLEVMVLEKDPLKYLEKFL